MESSKIRGKKIGKKFKVLSNNDIDGLFDQSAKKGIGFCDYRSKRLENYST